MKLLKPGDPCPCCGRPIKEGLPTGTMIFLSWLAEGMALCRATNTWEDTDPNEAVQNEPLTQADLDVMYYDKVWIDYGDDGEWALVVSGRIYDLAVLEGAGFEEILQDEVGGETMDRPSGNYTVYRRPPEGEADA